ncbi:UDP-N-acetylmuramate dehydrogenase [Dactylosporangium siamense]|uniref:UDP-N-acetylenolpyruvoylglucosamine reductase n=1 Tax=Dactylosporangium siamense TaxID=685454 RepID=A0A919PTV4_9ACTN|nr:UDP-N-acetylmuramate dehydrogenase [Dactylosporangium siamense]GIG50461.1 UDP-N-acetylenolpyruvoylglucosamine reductase [Dactylosporangium siamense]
MSSLAELTTLRLGGPADHLVEVTSDEEAVAAVRSSGKLLVLAGGSNVVIADEGFPGTVVLLRQHGITATATPTGKRLTVAAGHPWDDVVATAVANGWSGIESLSGIPGSAGATPIQNVGAYGQEVAETIAEVRVYDRVRDEILVMSRDACGFAYRTSVFKHNERFVVLSVTFELAESPVSTPIRYAELARALGVEQGEAAPLQEVRDAVVKLRAGKGMVLDPADRDTFSVGSFFTNPVVPAEAVDVVRAAAGEPPAWPAPDGMVKLSAAWLIERAGFTKGYGDTASGVGLSGKHTLALTNRGTGTTAALLDLAREIRNGVQAKFGVELHPEPVLVNCEI